MKLTEAMGTHYHHIRAEWDEMLAVYKEYGASGFDGHSALLSGVEYETTFDWTRIWVYRIHGFAELLIKSDLDLSDDELILIDFVTKLSSNSRWTEKPKSDLNVDGADSVVFSPTRVKEISLKLENFDIKKSLIRCSDESEKERTLDYLNKCVPFWIEAAKRGLAIIHAEF